MVTLVPKRVFPPAGGRCSCVFLSGGLCFAPSARAGGFPLIRGRDAPPPLFLRHGEKEERRASHKSYAFVGTLIKISSGASELPLRQGFAFGKTLVTAHSRRGRAAAYRRKRGALVQGCLDRASLLAWVLVEVCISLVRGRHLKCSNDRAPRWCGAEVGDVQKCKPLLLV